MRTIRFSSVVIARAGDAIRIDTPGEFSEALQQALESTSACRA